MADDKAKSQVVAAADASVAPGDSFTTFRQVQLHLGRDLATANAIRVMLGVTDFDAPLSEVRVANALKQLNPPREG